MTQEATSLEAAPMAEISAELGCRGRPGSAPLLLAPQDAPARALSSSYTANWMAPCETCECPVSVECDLRFLFYLALKCWLHQSLQSCQEAESRGRACIVESRQEGKQRLHQEQGGPQAAVEARQALLPRDVARRVQHAPVRARPRQRPPDGGRQVRPALQLQPRLDHPDGVGRYRHLHANRTVSEGRDLSLSADFTLFSLKCGRSAAPQLVSSSGFC